jgi:hypothetical protein
METILVLLAAILGVGLIAYVCRLLWTETRDSTDNHPVQVIAQLLSKLEGG